MEESRSWYVTSTPYMRQRSGELRVHDLTKTPDGARPVLIDAAFFHSAQAVLSRVVYPIALTATFLMLLFWKIFTTMGVYTVIALIANSMQRAALPYPALLNIVAYAQTLMLFIVAITLFLPFGIPAFSLISLSVTAGYICLAIKRHAPAAPLAV